MSKTEKKLMVIGVIAIVITMTLFFLDGDAGYPGFGGFLRTVFELVLMAGMIFLILAINFFAISFFARKIAGLFSKKKV